MRAAVSLARCSLPRLACRQDGSTALMWASRYGHTEAVTILCDKGAIKEVQNNASSCLSCTL